MVGGAAVALAGLALAVYLITKRPGDVSNPDAAFHKEEPAAIKTVADARRMIFNDYLDAAVAAFFMVSVVVILAASLQEWVACLRGTKPVISSEVPFEVVPAAGD